MGRVRGMDKYTAENIFDTLMDHLSEESRLPDVENAFDPGKPCSELYSQVYASYRRLCLRNQNREDEDVECIINNLLEICRIIGIRMFEYGIEYAKTDNTPAE